MHVSTLCLFISVNKEISLSRIYSEMFTGQDYRAWQILHVFLCFEARAFFIFLRNISKYESNEDIDIKWYYEPLHFYYKYTNVLRQLMPQFAFFLLSVKKLIIFEPIYYSHRYIGKFKILADDDHFI